MEYTSKKKKVWLVADLVDLQAAFKGTQTDTLSWQLLKSLEQIRL